MERITVYIVSNNTSGGSVKYLDDIYDNYKKYVDFVYISSHIGLDQHEYKQNDIIFLQHIFDMDITINDIIDIKNINNCKLIISIHDWFGFQHIISPLNVYITSIWKKIYQ